MGAPNRMAERASKALWQQHQSYRCHLQDDTLWPSTLFSICVHTNVGYSLVAEFVVQSKNTENIQEALAILKQWNAEWNPRYFMSLLRSWAFGKRSCFSSLYGVPMWLPQEAGMGTVDPWPQTQSVPCGSRRVAWLTSSMCMGPTCWWWWSRVALLCSSESSQRAIVHLEEPPCSPRMAFQPVISLMWSVLKVLQTFCTWCTTGYW